MKNKAIKITNSRLNAIRNSLLYEMRYRTMLDESMKVMTYTSFEKLFGHYEGYFGHPNDWQIRVYESYDYEPTKFIEKWLLKSNERITELNEELEREEYILRAIMECC